MRYIGVDLYKTNFVVCFLSEDEHARTETFTLNAQGLSRFKRRLRSDDHLAVEASANTFYFCRQIKYRVAKVVVVDTYRFAVIARSKKKTDKNDAAMQGRKRLRTTCIGAVLSMVNRTKTPLTEFYQQEKQEKGAGKAIVATARKLLVIIWVMLKKGLDYWYIEERLYNEKLRALRAAA